MAWVGVWAGMRCGAGCGSVTPGWASGRYGVGGGNVCGWGVGYGADGGMEYAGCGGRFVRILCT